MVEDPVWVGRKLDRFPSASKKAIPIYYVEVHPKDQGKKDSIAWSIIYGEKESCIEIALHLQNK